MMTIPIPEDASPTAQAAMRLYDSPGRWGEQTFERYRELARLVNDEGPECVLCQQRGLNCGRFAQPRDGGAWHAHLGCESDMQRDREKDRIEDEREYDGPLAW